MRYEWLSYQRFDDEQHKAYGHKTRAFMEVPLHVPLLAISLPKPILVWLSSAI